MKKIFLLFSILSITLSCERDNEFATVNLRNISYETNGSYQSNRLELQTSKEGEILILSKAGRKANLFDKAYVLQTEKPSTLPATTSKESILFENAILIESESDFLFLAVDLPETQKILTTLKQKFSDNQIISYFGYGFSIIKGEWQLDLKLDQSNVFKYLSIHDKTRNTFAKLPPEDGGGDDECTSGGPGATSCSIDETIGGSCSVTCARGYYACCKSSTISCRCVKSQPE